MRDVPRMMTKLAVGADGINKIKNKLICNSLDIVGVAFNGSWRIFHLKPPTIGIFVSIHPSYFGKASQYDR